MRFSIFFLVVGLTPKEIAIHYYGAEKRITIDNKSAAEEEFSLDDMEESPQTSVHQPSLKSLVAEGHFHLFGMSSFLFWPLFIRPFCGC